MPKPPTAFISYTWEDEPHKEWVQALASRLRGDGVDVTLDRWHAVPGDQLPAFMERAIRENDYVLIVCTPRYKAKSDARLGGVGYEGDVMTGEVLTTGNQRKFIPILGKGSWHDAAPSWLAGKYGIDLHGEPYSEDHYSDLLVTLHGQRSAAPPIGPAPAARTHSPVHAANPTHTTAASDPIRITGVMVDEVSKPRNDGTRGSALYAIPFQLSRRPSAEWSRLFVDTWNRPPSYTSMHRPGIARVAGDRVILDGTTIEEVEQYHRATLKLVVPRVNELLAQQERVREEREAQARLASQQHEEQVRRVAESLRFDDD